MSEQTCAGPAMWAAADTSALGRPVVVAAVGEVDAYTSGELRQRLSDLVTLGQHDLVVDLTGVTFIDSTGLGVLVRTVKDVLPMGGRVQLVTANPTMLKLLRITALNRVFTVHPTVEAALAEA
jgi:anti-sigma B factor antagonist